MFRFVDLQHLFTIALCTTLLTTGACVNRSNITDPVTELLPALVLTLSQNVLIIGDSLTDYSSGFGLQARLGPGYTVDFRGIINTDFNFWTGRLDETFAQAGADGGPPAHVLIPLGTNDAFTLTPPQFLERVSVFHNALRQRTFARAYYFLVPQTIIVSLAPAIAANNAALRAEFSNRFAGDNAVLVDLETVFQNASPVPPLYSASDPLHPTAAGYELISIEMQRALRP